MVVVGGVDILAKLFFLRLLEAWQAGKWKGMVRRKARMAGRWHRAEGWGGFLCLGMDLESI